MRSASTGTQHYRTKTGPIRKSMSASRRRKPITALTLADHDPRQKTLEDYNFVQYSQTTPVSANPLYAMTPNRKERIRGRLFPFSPGECMCAAAYMHLHVYCTCESIYSND